MAGLGFFADYIKASCDPNLIAVFSLLACRWHSHDLCNRLPLFSVEYTVTFWATEHHSPSASNKWYCCWVTESCVNNLTRVLPWSWNNRQLNLQPRN